MKVAVYYSNSDIRIEEREIPKINEGEILVKVKASGICGTDVMEWYRAKKKGKVMGHEISGEIVESKNSKYKKGDMLIHRGEEIKILSAKKELFGINLATKRKVHIKFDRL